MLRREEEAGEWDEKVCTCEMTEQRVAPQMEMRRHIIGYNN